VSGPTQVPIPGASAPRTRLSRSLAACSKRLTRNDWSSWWGPAAPPDWSFNPTCATPAGLTRTWFGLAPVRSPLLRGFFCFLGVHEMFQFPRFPPALCRSWPAGQGVAPFGDRAIIGCTRLPHAFRSVATSFIGAQRQGIHRVLILSSRSVPLVGSPTEPTAPERTHAFTSADLLGVLKCKWSPICAADW
jgi:hypothetical protein